jgi:hypothetical protein
MVDPFEIVRVLRIVEYTGTRARVEEVVAKSIHGEKDVSVYGKNKLVIRAATIGLYPEILHNQPGEGSAERKDD